MKFETPHVGFGNSAGSYGLRIGLPVLGLAIGIAGAPLCSAPAQSQTVEPRVPVGAFGSFPAPIVAGGHSAASVRGLDPREGADLHLASSRPPPNSEYWTVLPQWAGGASREDLPAWAVAAIFVSAFLLVASAVWVTTLSRAVARRTEEARQQSSALAESEARLIEAQRLARLGSWDLDLVAGKLHWSDEIYRIFELDPKNFSASYEAFLNAIHPDDRAAVDQAYKTSLASRTPYAIVHRLAMPDGRVKWVQERCETDFDADGKPLISRGTVQDVTEIKLAELQIQGALREKETLLREVHHRVKNNLQIIASLLYFESQKLSEPGSVAALADLRCRLNSMILVHEKLYRSSDLSRIDFADYLRSLFGEMERVQSRRVPPIVGRVSSHPVELPIELALPCGMIVTELVTNAYKHAFADGEAGSIDVRLIRSGGRATLTVSDDGMGLPADFDPVCSSSFGWMLVRNLADQVGGTISVARGRGTSVSLTIPCEAGR